MYRYEKTAPLSSIRRRIEKVLTQARSRNAFDFLVNARGAGAEWDSTRSEWLGSMGDPPDAMLVAAAKRSSILDIVSDDCDLITFDGICVYTANRNAVNAARGAGKLENP